MMTLCVLFVMYAQRMMIICRCYILFHSPSRTRVLEERSKRRRGGSGDDGGERRRASTRGGVRREEEEEKQWLCVTI